MEKFRASGKELMISLLVCSLTLPLLFFTYSKLFDLSATQLDKIHLTSAEDRELDFFGQLNTQGHEISLVAPSNDYDPIENIVRKRIKSISDENLEEFLSLVSPSDKASFSQSWNTEKHKKYRAIVRSAANSFIYFGYINYGSIKIALSCIKGDSVKVDTTPILMAFEGPHLSFLSPSDFTLRAVNYALSSGKLYLVKGKTLVPIPACVSTTKWE